MAMYAKQAIDAADELADHRGGGVAASAKGWAPVFARSAAALAHAICELADAIAGKQKDGTT